MFETIPIFSVIVIGSPSSGKVAFIREILEAFDEKRLAHAVNLDPSGDSNFDYDLIDIREKYDLSDFINEKGPKEAMGFCMDSILDDEEWFETHILPLKGNFLLFNMPGDLECLMHVCAIQRLNEYLNQFESHVMVVNLIDSQLVFDSMTLVGAYMNSLSMASLCPIPFITVLTKIDLLREDSIHALEQLTQCSDDQIIEDIDNFTCNELTTMTGLLFELMQNYEIPRINLFDITDPDSIRSLIELMDSTLEFINIGSPETDELGKEEEIEEEDLELNPSIIPVLNQEGS